jgi:hypothetical protein
MSKLRVINTSKLTDTFSVITRIQITYFNVSIQITHTFDGREV